MEEELSFIVDTKASDDSELLKTFNSPFPLFGGSKFSLGVESNDDKSDDEVSASHDEDEYFGKLILNNINNALVNLSYVLPSQAFHLHQSEYETLSNNVQLKSNISKKKKVSKATPKGKSTINFSMH